MKKILSIITALEVQVLDETQLDIIKKIRNAIEDKAKMDDDSWEQDESLTERIDAGIGYIDYNSINLALKNMMEALGYALKRNVSPQQIENILRLL